MQNTLKVNQSNVPRPNARPLGIGLPRPAWLQLNCFRTGGGRLQSSMHKSRLAPTLIYECGTLDQTTSHVILVCLSHIEPLEDTINYWSWMTRLKVGSTTLSSKLEEDLP